MLVAARDAGVKRLVYAGSSSAYGDTPTLPKREDMPTNPLSPYALQKLVGEQYLPDVHAALRLRNRHDPLLQRVRSAAGSRVAVLRRHLAVRDGAARRAASRLIYGDGEQTRDFTYVANVVDGVLRACEAPKAAGEVINVATGGRISLNELLRDDEPDRRDEDARRSTRTPRAGDVRDSQADITKAQQLLGYAPHRRARGRPRGTRSSGAAPESTDQILSAKCFGIKLACPKTRVSL